MGWLWTEGGEEREKGRERNGARPGVINAREGSWRRNSLESRDGHGIYMETISGTGQGRSSSYIISSAH